MKYKSIKYLTVIFRENNKQKANSLKNLLWKWLGALGAAGGLKSLLQ